MSNNLYACDQTSITITSAVDNGDGTYTYTVTICLGISPNWGGTSDLTITTDANIISSSTSSVSTTYTYCDTPLGFNGQGCLTGTVVMGVGGVGGNLVTTTATGNVSVMNGSLIISNSGDPLAPSDTQGPEAGDCAECGNGSQVCFDVTFTTDAPISIVNLLGAEDVNGNCSSPPCCPNEYDSTVPPLTSGGCSTVPTASFTSTSPLCEGSSFDFTNTGSSGSTMGVPDFSYSWTFSSGSPSTSTDENPSGITWSSPGTYSVTLTVCEAADNTCCADVTQSITVNDNPVISITGVDETCADLCDGSATSSVSGGTSAYTYSWSNGGTGADATGLCDGTYTVTVTDANGCIGTASVVIAPGVGPTAGFTYTGSSCLSTNSFTFTNTGTPISMNGPTIVWNFGDLGSSTAENPTYSYTTCGTFTVTQTITENGCSASTSQTVTVACEPTLTVTPTDETCAGACDGALDVTVTGGTSAYTYAWSNGPTTEDQSALCAGDYTVTVTDANGCTAVITGTVGVGGTSPVASFTYNGNQCLSGNSYDFTNTGTSQVMGVPAFSWDFGDLSGTSTVENPSYTYTSSGTYTVTLTLTDGSGCTDVATVTLEVYPDPAAAIVGVDETCPGTCDGSADLTPSGGTSPYTFSWASGETSEDLTNLCAGTYDVTVTDANGCQAIATIVIGVGAGPTAGFTASPLSACLTGNSFTFTNTGTTAMNGATFTWDFGDLSGTSTSENPSYSYSSTGTYTVTQTVTVSGCSAVSSLTVTVNPEPTGSIVGTNLLCNGVCIGEADLTPSGGTSPYTYAWSNGSTSQDLTSLCAGTYTVTITDDNGCIGTASIIITEPPLLTLGTAGTDILCNGLCSGSATSAVSGGTASYTYSWNTSPVQTTSGATGLCAQTYTLTLTDGNGCVLTSDVTIAEPTALAAPTSSVNESCPGACDGTVTVSPTGGTGAYTYGWDDPLFQNTSTATGLCSGTFNVTVTDANGCQILASAVVGSDPGPVAAFTTSADECLTGNGFTFTNTGTPGSMNGPTFSWDFGDLSGTSTAENPTYSYTACGTFTVTQMVSFNGCDSIITQSVTIFCEPTVTMSGTDLLCNSVCTGTATATAGSGTPSYTYIWSDGQTTSTATGLCAGIAYNVTVSDANGCQVIDSQTLTEPLALTATISVTNDPLCNGGTGDATVSAGGGTGTLTYSWSPTGGTTATGTGLLAGTLYTVTVTDANGCTATATVTLSEPTVLAASITGTTDPLCNGGTGDATVTASGGTTTYTYAWSPTGGTGATGTGLLAGTLYTVTVTDANGCTTTATVTLSEPT
ncbi:MAG: hypothetical protein COB85_01045, partial [Bacteroidetes bacterium]